MNNINNNVYVNTVQQYRVLKSSIEYLEFIMLVTRNAAHKGETIALS